MTTIHFSLLAVSILSGLLPRSQGVTQTSGSSAEVWSSVYVALCKDPELLVKKKVNEITDRKLFEATLAEMGYSIRDEGGILYAIDEKIYKTQKLSDLGRILNYARGTGLPAVIETSKTPDLKPIIKNLISKSRFAKSIPAQVLNGDNFTLALGVNLSGSVTTKAGTIPVECSAFPSISTDLWPAAKGTGQVENKGGSSTWKPDQRTVLFGDGLGDVAKNTLSRRAFEIAEELESKENGSVMSLGDQLLKAYFEKLGFKDGWIGRSDRAVDKMPEQMVQMLLQSIKANPNLAGTAEEKEAWLRSGVFKSGKCTVMVSFGYRKADGTTSGFSISLPAMLR